MEKLHKVDLDILNENESDGECMILGNFDGHFQGKIVDCTESHSVSIFFIDNNLEFIVLFYIKSIVNTSFR